MKWASERPGFDTSVHSWKPCPAERFAKLVHGYAAECGDAYGHAGLSMTACKLDHQTIATIYYRPKQYPDHSGTSTPVLMTVATNDGRVITFERIPSAEYPTIPKVTGLPLPVQSTRSGWCLHFAFADDAMGTNFNDHDGAWLGICRSRSSTWITDWRDYLWTQITPADAD